MRRERGGVGAKEAVRMDRDERHLTGVGFEAKEAAVPYGKENGWGSRKQVCDGSL
jgi:hypothetical protein